jgi:hypothetical protein
MSDVIEKVIKLVDSTNEMINLSYKSIELYHKMNRAVIKEKLLKDVANKVIQRKELSADVKDILLKNNINIDKVWNNYRGDKIVAYDNGIIELNTYVKNVDTIVYVIKDKVFLCPMR